MKIGLGSWLRRKLPAGKASPHRSSHVKRDGNPDCERPSHSCWATTGSRRRCGALGSPGRCRQLRTVLSKLARGTVSPASGYHRWSVGTGAGRSGTLQARRRLAGRPAECQASRPCRRTGAGPTSWPPQFAPRALRELVHGLIHSPSWRGRLHQALFSVAQRGAERRHARIRRDLLKLDEQLASTLAFSGRME